MNVPCSALHYACILRQNGHQQFGCFAPEARFHCNMQGPVAFMQDWSQIDFHSAESCIEMQVWSSKSWGLRMLPSGQRLLEVKYLHNTRCGVLPLKL